MPMSNETAFYRLTVLAFPVMNLALSFLVEVNGIFTFCSVMYRGVLNNFYVLYRMGLSEAAYLKELARRFLSLTKSTDTTKFSKLLKTTALGLQ